MKSYMKLIRVKHWIKNFLIFLPLIFSGNLFNTKYYLIAFLGFIIFSLTTSVVYVFNDIQDIEKDKKHPTKKERPLAKGIISIKQANILIIGLIIAIITALIILNAYINNIYIITAIILIYLIINIMYSKGLKNIVIIDVVILVSGFLLRVIFGSFLTEIPISNWLYLMIIFSAFYLGFGKRRNEYQKHSEKGTRKVLKKYNREFLDKNMYMCSTLSIMCYSLWCLDTETIIKTGNNLLVWSIPLLMIVMFRYSLNIEGNSEGDPTDIILNDKPLLGTIAFYIIYIFTILYII